MFSNPNVIGTFDLSICLLSTGNKEDLRRSLGRSRYAVLPAQ